MIPVIGIPYINNEDLLVKLIDSIPSDAAEVIHVIDNSPDGLSPDFVQMATFIRSDIQISRMHSNLGVGASWNLVMRLHPKARWWAHFNSDIVLTREKLDRLERSMRLHELTYLSDGMAAFGVRASCITKVGWFDENYVPAYCEDIDYDYRCQLLGVHIENLKVDVEHFGSATLKGSVHYQRENGRSYPANRQYYEAKWGGFVGHESYTTPFDEGGSPRDWTLDMARLQRLSWSKE